MLISKAIAVDMDKCARSEPFYYISFIAVAICSAPLFAKSEYSSSVKFDLYIADISSKALLYATIAIMGSVTPMIIFLFCDILVGTLRAALIQFYRLATILTPCSLIIFFAVPNSSIPVLAFAFTAQSILHLCGFLGRIYSYGNKMWSFRTTVTIMLLWTSALCLRMQMLLFEWNFYFFVIETLLCVIGLVIYSFYFLKWIVFIMKQLKKNGEMSIEEFSVTKNAVILIVAVIIRIIVTITLESSKATGCLVTSLITQNLAVLLVVVVHEYVLHSQVARMEVSVLA